MTAVGSIWILAAPHSTQEAVFYIEMDASQMEEEESEPVSVFTSENGRWEPTLPKVWQGRPLVEGGGIHPSIHPGYCC